MSTTATYHEAWLPGPDGTNFYTRTYEAVSPRAALLFVHGFAEYVGRYEWAHGIFRSQGITVFAFDQRGFGHTGMDIQHRSKGSRYCKTSWPEQQADIEWWLRHINKQYPTLPIFMMGHSMGGGFCLGFPTRASQEVNLLLSGVIASSPFLDLPKPVPRSLRFAAKLIGRVFPLLLVQAPVNINALTHNPVHNEAVSRDPMCPTTVAVKALGEALDITEEIFRDGYKRWPRTLPLLILHGTSDEITSCPASQEFIQKVEAEDKELILIEGGFHELVHEPDGVKEKYVDDCISWILKRAKGNDSVKL